MYLKKVNCVALLVSHRAKALSCLYRPRQNGGETRGGIGWICLKKSANYRGCEIKFGINVIHACSLIISKENVELFKCSTGNGRRKRETDERTARHHGSQYIIDVFPSKELRH